jgi:hypothetical protein
MAQSRKKEVQHEPYFNEIHQQNLGLVSLNPSQSLLRKFDLLPDPESCNRH